MLLALRRATSPSVVHLRHVAELGPEDHTALLIANLPQVTEDPRTWRHCVPQSYSARSAGPPDPLTIAQAWQSLANPRASRRTCATPRQSARVIAVYAGRLDPVTNGHLDIVRRAARIYERVIVAVYEAPENKTLFPTSKRIRMLEACLEDESSVAVEPFGGLLTDFVRSRGAGAIVRGMRADTDFSVEFDQAPMYKNMAPEIEQVYLMSDLKYVFELRAFARSRPLGTMSGTSCQNRLQPRCARSGR